ncbi:MAG: tRNA (adenosine(37)-N6)-threonylcarbamoyltransferase complex ATPase subunit type 1 TsaE [Planctomycetes bacterium]|nr:tRNA (adenosine(37)-N6)-threonylcarbamoyltransferase complex ATPase subunit type 1 TsaE [Planctomycetota bacterium]
MVTNIPPEASPDADGSALGPGLLMQLIVTTTTPDETRAVGRHVGGLLQGGEVILLRGDLGSGKTCFVQGLAEGLGVETRVTSPTFTIHAEYTGRLVLNHLDLYRLENPVGLADLGIFDMLGDSRSATAIEWPELLGEYGGDRLDIAIQDLGDGKREFSFSVFGRSHAHLLT